MKLLFLFLSVFMLLFQCENVQAKEVVFKPEELCNSNHYDKWDLANLKSAHQIDVNSDSVSELLVHMQYNNNARFHLFYLDDCGYREVTDNHGEDVNFLSYSSSIACQPLGCLDSTYCEDNDGQRFLVSVVGRHSLSLEDKHRWMDGKLPDSEVSSQVTTTRYRLVDGKLIATETEIKPDMPGNIGLLDKRGDGGWGFETNSCF